jgi:hypothetical protein
MQMSPGMSDGEVIELRLEDGEPRHYLAGKPVNTGEVLELQLQDGSWALGRYEWDCREQDLPVFLSAEGGAWWSQPGMKFRWPKLRPRYLRIDIGNQGIRNFYVHLLFEVLYPGEMRMDAIHAQADRFCVYSPKSAALRPNSASSVEQTGLKSAWCENKTTQLSPCHSLKRMAAACVVTAVL